MILAAGCRPLATGFRSFKMGQLPGARDQRHFFNAKLKEKKLVRVKEQHQ
jgi:hypothetical protein